MAARGSLVVAILLALSSVAAAAELVADLAITDVICSAVLRLRAISP